MFGNWFKRDNDIFLGRQKDSIFFLGMDTRNREIWLNSSILRQHILVSGTTGAGKTEALLGMFSNTFAWGSGGIYVDGKGDVALYAKIYAMSEHHGRLNDLYVLNFMSGSETSGATMRTHRFNPFAKGNADTLTRLVISLIPPEDFAQEARYGRYARATAMFTGVMRALCWMRDNRNQRLDAGVLYEAIRFNHIVDMANSQHYSFLPDQIRKTIRSYLSSIPRYQEDMGYGQSQTTLDEHGILEMQFARIFGVMSDAYGHIFCAGTSDIDFADILWNRRLLHVMLPALEKSSDEISLLGRIVLSSLRHAISEVLMSPSRTTDEHPDGNEPINITGGMPFISIFDDVSYYMVEGLDLLAAQARAVGIGIVFSCGDVRSLSKVSAAALGNIASSAATKVVMKGCGSQSELNDIFFDVVGARDDVVAGIDRLIGIDAAGGSPRRSVFRSPSNVVKHLNEGEFVLVSSGKMLLGKSSYINSFIPMIRNLSGPAHLHDFTAVADMFVQMTENKKKAETLQDLPDGMAENFIKPHERSASAAEMLSHALKVLEAGKMSQDGSVEEEIIRIGE